MVVVVGVMEETTDLANKFSRSSTMVLNDEELLPVSEMARLADGV